MSNLRDPQPEEEGAINEGLSDYFAGAFTGRPEILDWAAPRFRRNMASPTGNNGGMSSSPITTYQRYLAEQSVEPHRGGEFFSFVLWSLRNGGSVPVTALDRIVLDAVGYVGPGVDFAGFRDAMVVADQSLYGGQHRSAILQGFAEKGIDGGTPPGPNLHAYISGPTCQDPSGPNTYHRGAYGGGASPHVTVWHWRKLCGLSAVPCGAWNAGSHGTDTYSPSFSHDYEVMLSVQDADGHEAHSNVIYVNYRSGGCPQQIGPTSQATSIQQTMLKDFTLPDVAAVSALWPNPTRTNVNLDVAFPSDSDVTVQFFDALGRRVLPDSRSAFTAGRHSIPLTLDSLPSGVYRILVTAYSSDGGPPVVVSHPLTVVR